MKKTLFILAIILLCAIFYFAFAHNKNDKYDISFSSWGSQSETAILKEIISEYEKENNVRIKFIHIPENYFQKIQLLFASGLEPDVVFFNNQNIKMYIKAGLLEDLTPYTDKDNFFPQSVNCFIQDNKIYAIPRDISTLVIYYNKDILDKYGISLSGGIKDIQALIKILNKVSDDNHFGINYEGNSLFWSYYLASTGGGILSDDSKNLIINSDKSIKALQLYSDMINKYHIMPTKAQIGSQTSAQMFINESIVMYLSGRWMTPKFRETINFNWDVVEFPASSENKLYADASGWAVSKNSKHKKEAIDFIKYLSSEKTLNKIAQSGLIIPADRKSAEYTINNDRDKKPKNSKIFIDMLDNTKPTPVNENYAAINDIINEKADLIFSGKIKPENAFDKNTQEKIERLLK